MLLNKTSIMGSRMLLSRPVMFVGMMNRRSAASRSGTGILMLNMGGPGSGSEVEAFLTRLFLDRDIIKLPFQKFLGPLIARRRTPDIVKKYEEIGGGSPILQWTQIQGSKLCALLDKESPETSPHKPFVGFRYAHPLTENTLDQMENCQSIDKAIAFSQYPQYSCTTSGSSFTAMAAHYSTRSSPTRLKWHFLDRWASEEGLARVFAANIRATLEKEFEDEGKRSKVVILFSAHSIPQYVANRGDPYPAEIAATVGLVMRQLNHSNPYRLVWQSKVGPLPWLQPSTEEAIKALVRRGHRNLLLVPISFVNEHIETLHELDIEYAEELGKSVGAEHIARAPAPNDNELFIRTMADLVLRKLRGKERVNKQLLMRCPMCTNNECSRTKAWITKTALT